MTTDVFDLAEHEQAGQDALMGQMAEAHLANRAQPAAQPPEASVPWEMADLLTPTGDPDKLPFLSWLWNRHVPGDPFYPLAHLILTGGPGDVWARKTSLIPAFVARDIAEFFAVGRPGITEEHLDLANKAVQAYRDSTDTVSALVAKRRRFKNGGTPDQLASREVKNAQLAGFLELGTLPVSRNANNPVASISEMVPAVNADEMPDSFRPVKVRCLYQHQDTDTKTCGRPTVAGSLLCAHHGGAAVAYTHEELKEVYNGARQRLIAATLMAVDATIDLAQNAVNETVRLKAAEVILDRTGFVPGVEVHLPGASQNGTIDKTPAQIVLDRLHQLGIETPSATPNGHNTDGTPDDESDVVDAEVVADSSQPEG
jgi:hypothetical protein